MSTTPRPETRTAALVSRRVTVAANPSAIFALLAAPGEHAGLDGTGQVQGVVEGPERLEIGSMFRMRMKGYTTTNTVVEFEDDALIAWRHRGRHVWRWRLRAVPEGTEVTENLQLHRQAGPAAGTADRCPAAGRYRGGQDAHRAAGAVRLSGRAVSTARHPALRTQR
ncbi:SRPBCC family protein [Streptomyces sp. NPDC126514]|uniref:SRPBCC family protein n=1 Tax=Streptomyces sp. NPDC126514 TaxID=3155210 RepID=UPI0033344CB2